MRPRVIVLALIASGALTAPALFGLSPAHAETPVISATVIVRPYHGNWLWHIRTDSAGSPDGAVITSFVYGKVTDIPVTGDWTGSGSVDPGVVRPAGASWEYLLRNSDTTGTPDTTLLYGRTATDIPVVGDWDGNGTTTPGVIRPDGIHWEYLLRNSNTTGTPDTTLLYGRTATDMAVAGTYPASGAGLTLRQWAGTRGPMAADRYYGYPYSNPPACTDGGACIADKLDFYRGQCVSWVAYRLSELNGIAFTDYFGGKGRWGDAAGWGKHAAKLGIAVNSTPAVGSVAWYSSDHVAYVERVNSPTSVVISEMNYDADNGFRVRTITTASGWPTDFIHIADR